MNLTRKLKRPGLIAVRIALTAAAIHVGARQGKALPMFARRYSLPCSTCHTSPPRLNETGYQFRANGFRMSSEEADDAKSKLVNYVGFRLQPRYDVTRSSVASNVTTKQDARLFAAEGYFLYGPISKNFSSNVKITFWPEQSNETELTERLEGTIRYRYGSDDNFVDLRAGVPHPHEGIGGSESYVASDTRPFIQELRTANFNQDTFFTPFGFHQAGGSVGYYYKRTTVRAQVTTGIRVKLDKEGKLEPFGLKDPLITALPQGERGGPDFNLFFNQILHHQAGNVSVYYYNGRSFLPRLDLLPQTAGGIPDVSTVPFFKNNFNRLAFYAGYPVNRVNFLYGLQRGRDTIGSGGRFSSLGQFGEVMVRVINDISALGARYDWFDPARIKDENEMTGLTAYMNLWLHRELRVTPEYQYVVQKNGPGQPNRVDNRFQLRLYWVR